VEQLAPTGELRVNGLRDFSPVGVRAYGSPRRLATISFEVQSIDGQMKAMGAWKVELQAAALNCGCVPVA